MVYRAASRSCLYRKRPIELVISGINMPLLEGLDLAAQVSQVIPACRLILLSAVCDQAEIVERVGALSLTATFLTKPLLLPCLLSAINEAFAGIDTENFQD
jgi:YesN/AraC family two-component response regulator